SSARRANPDAGTAKSAGGTRRDGAAKGAGGAAKSAGGTKPDAQRRDDTGRREGRVPLPETGVSLSRTGAGCRAPGGLQCGPADRERQREAGSAVLQDGGAGRRVDQEVRATRIDRSATWCRADPRR